MRLLSCMLVLAVLLGGCGKKQEETKAEVELKMQADIAKSKLQEKADALARSAAKPPPIDNNAKPKKP